MTTGDHAALDPRINAYRSDLANIKLKGVVRADAYAEGQHALVAVPKAPVRGRPEPEASMTTEFLFGEPVTVFEDRSDDWVWAQSTLDCYVGYLPAASLGPAVLGAPDPTPVTALSAPVFQRPDIKSPVTAVLPMGALPICEPVSDDFAAAPSLGGYIHRRHLMARDRSDIAATAAMFLHVPYVWGGRSAAGIDCSGLVQRALQAAGIAAPRDSDQLAATVGDPVPFKTAEDGTAQWDRVRGDIVVFPGHIGIMMDDMLMVHANAAAMAVSIDSVDTVARRCCKAEGRDDRGVTAVRRLNAGNQ